MCPLQKFRNKRVNENSATIIFADITREENPALIFSVK